MKRKATHGPGQTFHRCSWLLLFWVWICPPVAQGPQTGPPKTSSHASSCATPNHWSFFFFKKKQLHLSLSLARKSHALQCRYKVWVPALKAYISLYSLAPGGRLREEGQGMGSGRSFQLSGFAFLKPVLDKSVYYYLLLLHRLSLFQKGWERLQRGHKLRFPAILFSPCFSSFSGWLVTVPSPEFEPLQTPSFNQIT